MTLCMETVRMLYCLMSALLFTVAVISAVTPRALKVSKGTDASTPQALKDRPGYWIKYYRGLYYPVV